MATRTWKCEGEALLGLALRKDPAVLDPLTRDLEGRQVLVRTLEAAEALGDKRVLPLLLRLRDSGGEANSHFGSMLASAIAALDELP